MVADTASHGTYAAGIGGGDEGNGGTINISGGTVTATSYSNGAGIGTGYECNNNTNSVDVTINGGTVTAIGVDKGIGSERVTVTMNMAISRKSHIFPAALP